MVISSTQITQAKPRGPNQPVTLEAQYSVTADVQRNIPSAQVNRVLMAVEPQVKRIIGDSVRRAYAASGLTTDSGQLLQTATNNFAINIRYIRSAGVIFLVAKWFDPLIPYFFIHLFGGTIRAKNSPFLVFQTRDGRWHKKKEVTIPRRGFIELDAVAADQIRQALTGALKPALEVMIPLGGRRPQVITVPAGGPQRLTPHRMRSILRRSAGISHEEARAGAKEAIAAGGGIVALATVLAQIRKRQEPRFRGIPQSESGGPAIS